MSTFQNDVDVQDHDGSAAGLKLGGTLVTATADELNNIADVSGRIVTLAATTLAVTAATHGDRIVVMNHTGAASTATLPAATGSGNRYLFIVGAVNTSNHVITTTGDDDIEGIIHMAQDSADTSIAFESGATADTITLNGTTTGGAAVGDYVELIDYGS